MSLRQAFADGLRARLLAGEPYAADAVDAALNEATDGYVASRPEAGLDFRELFDLAREYHVHDRAAASLHPRPPGHELAAYRGAGEVAGSALAEASRQPGTQAFRDPMGLRNSLTDYCLRHASRNPLERVAMLAWLSGFHAGSAPGAAPGKG